MSDATPSVASAPTDPGAGTRKDTAIAPSQAFRRELALLEAAGYGQISRAKRYIESGDVDVDFIDSEGRSALHFATENGHREIVQALIQAKCDVDASSKIHGTALCLASLKSHMDIVGDLLQAGADVNAPGGGLGSALHAACRVGNMKTFELLVEHGATIDSVRTLEATLVNAKLNVPKSDLPKGIKHDFNRGQPIHRAVTEGHVDIVRKLLDLSVNVDVLCDLWYSPTRSGSFDSAQDRGKFGGCTALYLAAYRGKPSVIELLLQRGARVDAKPTLPQDRAAALGIAAASNHVQCMTLLLDAGAEIDHSVLGITPLFMAVYFSHADAAKLLLERGARPTTTLNDGLTALHYVRTAEIVELLAKHGAAVDHAVEKSGTPLTQAAFRENSSGAIRKLIDLGANVNYRLLPLASAVTNKRIDNASILLQHGANPRLLGSERRTELNTMAENNAELKAILEKAKKRRESGFLRKLVSRSKATSSRSSGNADPSSSSAHARSSGELPGEHDVDEDTLCGESMVEVTKEVAQLKI